MESLLNRKSPQSQRGLKEAILDSIFCGQVVHAVSALDCKVLEPTSWVQAPFDFLQRIPGNGFPFSTSSGLKRQCRAPGDSLGELSGWPATARRPPDPSCPALSRHTWGQAEPKAPRGQRGAGDSPAAARPAGSTSTSGRGPSRPPPGTPPPPPWRARARGPGRHRDGGSGCAVAEDRATGGPSTGPGGDGGPSSGDGEGRPGGRTAAEAGTEGWVEPAVEDRAGLGPRRRRDPAADQVRGAAEMRGRSPRRGLPASCQK